MQETNHSNKIIVFGGGCFWCTEAVFRRLKGVAEVMPGYANGNLPAGGKPTYEQVSSGSSGFVEVAHVTYNPNEVPLSVLLDVFFSSHDPTTLNRQGADVGTQYRSGVYYVDEDQKTEIEVYIQKLKNENTFQSPIVTEVQPLQNYFEAENYHKDYYENNRDRNPYCRVVIDPKIAKLRKNFSQYFKEPTN